MSKRLSILLILIALLMVGCGGGDLAGAAGAQGGGGDVPVHPSNIPPPNTSMEEIKGLITAGDYSALEGKFGDPFIYMEYVDMTTTTTTEFPSSEAVGVIMDIAGGGTIAFPEENPGIIIEDLFDDGGIPYGEAMSFSTGWMPDGEGEAFLIWGPSGDGGILLLGIIHSKGVFPRG